MRFGIAKTERDGHMVFGWAWVARGADGREVVDSQGDAIEPEELERAAYRHVLEFRSAGEGHDPALRGVGVMVERRKEGAPRIYDDIRSIFVVSDAMDAQQGAIVHPAAWLLNQQ